MVQQYICQNRRWLRFYMFFLFFPWTGGWVLRPFLGFPSRSWRQICCRLGRWKFWKPKKYPRKPNPMSQGLKVWLRSDFSSILLIINQLFRLHFLIWNPLRGSPGTFPKCLKKVKPSYHGFKPSCFWATFLAVGRWNWLWSLHCQAAFNPESWTNWTELLS